MTIRIDRVYTKGGDRGETSLVGGKRLPKNHMRIEAYGTVDELNSVVGCCRAEIKSLSLGDKNENFLEQMDQELATIQQDLFDMGADLATPIDLKDAKAKLKELRVQALEKKMDHWQEKLPALTSFVLPGGSRLPATIHMARAVSRRAERRVVQLLESEEIIGPSLIYLNRLSDFFFVMARFACTSLKEAEVLWQY